MPEVLITGGAGFIGSHLTEALLARGDTVTVLDDFSTGRPENLSGVTDHPRLRVVTGSVLDEPVVGDLISRAEICVHLASAVGVEMIIDSPLASLRANVRGNDAVISAAARAGVRLLYASSSEVYGKTNQGLINEDSDRVAGSPFVSRWSYGIAKAHGEALLNAYCLQGGLTGTVARLFNTVGPRQRGGYGMVLPRLAAQALAGHDLTVYGTGRQTRCFTHVTDVVAALVLLLEADEATGRAFNVGRPVECSILDLAEMVRCRAGSKSEIRLVPYAEAFGDGFEELGRRVPDISAITKLTGWEPRLSLEHAIDDVLTERGGRVGAGAAIGEAAA